MPPVAKRSTSGPRPPSSTPLAGSASAPGPPVRLDPPTSTSSPGPPSTAPGENAHVSTVVEVSERHRQRLQLVANVTPRVRRGQLGASVARPQARVVTDQQTSLLERHEHRVALAVRGEVGNRADRDLVLRGLAAAITPRLGARRHAKRPMPTPAPQAPGNSAGPAARFGLVTSHEHQRRAPRRVARFTPDRRLDGRPA